MNDEAGLDEVQLESKVRKRGGKYGKIPKLTHEVRKCRISPLLSGFKGAVWGVTSC